MVSKSNFEKDYIELQIKKYPKVDPSKMEMTIFAFGLLDELARSNLPFIFKGGTSLLLLLDNPQRISTDIDICIPKEVEFDKIFEKIKERFPFYEGEERGEIPNKYFRHFYFMFKGPISKKECHINLDVAFEDNPYPKTIKKEIITPFLLTTGERTFVNVPSRESILGDKLTAFAPTTIGVNPFTTSLGKPIDNRLQVMKQFYDIARLYDHAVNLSEVMDSYRKCQMFENIFRGSSYTLKQTLLDTFNHAAEIASMGLWNKGSSFYSNVAKPGIQGLMTNIFDGKYNQIYASSDAAKIMHLSACLMTNASLNQIPVGYKGDLLKNYKAIPDKKSFKLIKISLALLTGARII